MISIHGKTSVCFLRLIAIHIMSLKLLAAQNCVCLQNMAVSKEQENGGGKAKEKKRDESGDSSDSSPDRGKGKKKQREGRSKKK